MPKKKKPDDTSEVNPEISITEPDTSEKKKRLEKEPGDKKKDKNISGLNTFAAACEKKWGTNVSMGSALSFGGVDRVSFGNIGLDIGTFGGSPRGRMIRLWGQPKSAKTGSALNLVAEWQKHCSVCYKRDTCNCDNREPAGALWVDAEGRSLDNRSWMEAHGVDMSHLIVVQPSKGEQAVDIIDAALRDDTSGIGIIVLDSIAHVVSSKELDKATEDGEVMAVNAKLMNSALRKWTSALTAKGAESKNKSTLVLLNQIRSKVSMYGGDVMPGGRGLDFATSLDIKFSRGDPHYIVNQGTEEKPEWVDKAVGFKSTYKTKEDDQPDYVEIEYKVTESSICPKGRYGTFNYWLRSTHGHRLGDPDNASRIFDYAKNYGMLGRSGRNYALRHLTGATQDDVRTALYGDPKLQQELWAELVEKLKK